MKKDTLNNIYPLDYANKSAVHHQGIAEFQAKERKTSETSSRNNNAIKKITNQSPLKSSKKILQETFATLTFINQPPYINYT